MVSAKFWQHSLYGNRKRHDDLDLEQKDGITPSSKFHRCPRLVAKLGKVVARAIRFCRVGVVQQWYILCFDSRRKRGRTKTRLGRIQSFLRFAFMVIGAIFVISAAEAWLFPSYQNPPQHYNGLSLRIDGSADSGRGNLDDEKIFIAANIINENLIRGAWGDTLIELVHILGEDNVFVSIYENDSGTGTRDALKELKAKLPCNSSVVTGGHLSISELPKVTLPKGQQQVKRIAYLAEIRNRLLRPLDRSYIPARGEENDGFRHTETKFDRILFLNDVYFSATDAVQLLFSTNADKNGKSRYRAACAIDFGANTLFYDTFVVRDIEGYGIGFKLFPWFVPIGEAQSRRAVLAEMDAVPVRSCWGGMVAFHAELFQRPHAIPGQLTDLALQFRHDPEPFWESAECCLIFADIEEKFGRPSATDGTGVFINPFIRVAYTQSIWNWLPFFKRYERIFANFQYIISKIAYPEHNPRRLHESGQLVTDKVWVSNADRGQGKIGGSWEMIERHATPGGFCGQRRLFVMKDDIETVNLIGDVNWANIRVPR